MKLLADENVDESIVRWLRAQGVDVARVYDVCPGASDEEVMEAARHGGQVLLTSDRDFGELVFRHGLRPTGLVYLRLRAESPTELLAQFQRAWLAVAERVVGAFVVITPGPIRVRPLP